MRQYLQISFPLGKDAQLKFIMHHPHSQYLSHAPRITRLKESVDDLEILIESARSTIHSPETRRFSKQITQSTAVPDTNYHIRIDDPLHHSSIDFQFNIDHHPHSYYSATPVKQDRYQISDRAAIQSFSPYLYQTNFKQSHAGSTSFKTQPREHYQTSQKKEKSFGQLKRSDVRVGDYRRSLLTQNSENSHQASHGHSPQVYNYADDEPVRNDEFIISNPRSTTPPKQANMDTSLVMELIESPKFRQQPEEISLEKKAEQMISRPPTLSEIPQTVPVRSPARDPVKDPIIVPIHKTPKLYKKQMPKHSRLNSTIGTTDRIPEPKTVKVDLRSQKKRPDIFIAHKNRFLNSLRQAEKMRLESSRTLSNRKRSLSPACQRITDRLYNSKINEQPCPKYQHYLRVLQRMKMRDTIRDYTFVRRYLSDGQICDIFDELARDGVPQHKWPQKVVDVVYSKVNRLIAY